MILHSFVFNSTRKYTRGIETTTIEHVHRFERAFKYAIRTISIASAFISAKVFVNKGRKSNRAKGACPMKNSALEASERSQRFDNYTFWQHHSVSIAFQVSFLRFAIRKSNRKNRNENLISWLLAARLFVQSFPNRELNSIHCKAKIHPIHSTELKFIRVSVQELWFDFFSFHFFGFSRWDLYWVWCKWMAGWFSWKNYPKKYPKTITSELLMYGWK